MKSSAVAAASYVQDPAVTHGTRPASDYVISRYADGRVGSRYGDLQWDWTPYSSNGRYAFLNFKFWRHSEPSRPAREFLVSEMQFIIYLVARKRLGSTLSEKTLDGYLSGLRSMARFCEQNAICIQDILTRKEHLLSYVLERSTRQTPCHAVSLLSTLAGIGAKELGYEVLGDQMLRALRQLVQQFAPARQHSPIPTRIYSQVISVLIGELTAFESVAEAYLGLTAQCVSNPLLGRSKASQRAAARRLNIALNRPKGRFPELLAQQGLTEYFRAKGLKPAIQGLTRGLARIQVVARLVIHVFTGMRDEEVSALQYSCLETERRCGKDHFVLAGSTTKFNHGRAKSVRWVTGQEAARAVRLARRITDLCYRAFNRQGDPAQPTPATAPLFAAISYLECGTHRPTSTHGRMLPGRLAHWSRLKELRALLQPTIEEADLHELEQIDPHRAWRSEPQFQVGIPWTLTSHQLRRSLALYAQRSGLVSLPSLRRQLQHITEEMSRYYARGSAFAKELIGDNKNHFGCDWQDAQPVSAAMSYLKNVLLTDEVLFGAHGNWVEKRLRDQDDTVIIDRETTLRRFKKGELAYRETSLGGCANTQTCDKLPISWLNIECIKGCRHFVGRLPKLERAIVIQTKLTKSIEPTSAEFRIENDDLNVLIKARDRVRQRVKELA